ncbi:2-amino-4-hydroxy-6-hydroxymethyldihydropteridine diphosphokinase [Shewanella inventionis]|uniref:2-amino-4-hydroxy-6-hydroxymethyldihydropteridine pyrophosphokinase n=1 Tax=Shewanella inventionis TaxID=1738770 RepID=A0ABQ1IW08_9GAMM|nr:2-amino-4-hydroxy-6-hydroxymethyldihydropteridine diphosphokinase [Shewanella inventionis]MCL1158499.1 2-amino-4-hydroxy-6-hydroxymethyldihydropteridine diphosphokinase [Shewanella inventionis]UAL44375.1 2-amino-4-hydroxy-6-hydroxymethyldihydropteridine diphosphokinase [Shewanella inventionis]GGB52606.1 2-amino-4-hydroxy-6-hydroxymethyldihydropteridine diphosphokinase [Shewanella inventionis]
MATIQVYVALGANLANPTQQLDAAVAALCAIAVDDSLQVSSYYHSKPMGDVVQPDYVNAVAGFKTTLQPIDLLDALQAIEQQQGRVRLQHWGPRTLDLDLLLYGQQNISVPRLTVPHYGMKQRSFVLIPLAEITPTLTLPCGTSLESLISVTMRDELQKLIE